MNIGSIVQVRNRYWVLLPHQDPDLYLLRPLTGSEDETLTLHKRLTDLLGYTLPQERPCPATFPLPRPEDVSDAVGAHLLWQAARLTLREGASPLRSLGRISIRPRTYQFVPLLMALRLDPARLLIADDVGVGKTIEALLIARELWERGEIRRLAVLCPPYLCDQWQQELRQKFNFHEAVIIRSGTVRQLERDKPPARTIYEHYPVQVISIDFIKSEHNRHAFLLHAPELIIVDEAHGATMARNQSQQQRHEFLREVAKDPNRHLILLTATPHSGIESAFRSLLGLLSPRFAEWDVHDLNEERLRELARHFVQRTRGDIEHDWESDSCFPQRIPEDRTYRLSSAYRDLFQKTYDFCAEIVRTGQHLEERKRRVRYWGALALLRCVMSSPAAALAALETRHLRAGEREKGRAGEDWRAGERESGGGGEDEVDFRGFVFESDQDRTDDEQPTPPIEETEATLPDSERRRLRALGKLAAALLEAGQDTKLEGLIQSVADLLKAGYHPIVWCRYVATAEYVADALQKRLAAQHPLAQIVCITGRQADEERRARIAEIDADHLRVLVATDCLSEGINLQEKFTAAIHYDLPWNPNRLEQREGRVDRYGQPAKQVKVIRYYGADNPVDGVVLEVLLDKAREIHKALGTHVPVPEESESVTEAVLNALFLRGGYRPEAQQLAFDFMQTGVNDLHARWQRDAEREKTTRTRFAQRALKPQEVQRELEAADAVLGDPQAVRVFVQEAAQRLGMVMRRAGERERGRAGEVWEVEVSPAGTMMLPEAVRFAMPERKDGRWRVSFESPTPEGAEYLGRNHPFVTALARFLLEEALTKGSAARAARVGVIATRAVTRPTVLLLLRVRYLVHVPNQPPLFSEEVRALGCTPSVKSPPEWLPEAETLRLLAEAQPDANLPRERKQALAQAALDAYSTVEPFLKPHIEQRARDLEAAHKRIRKAVRLRVQELTVEAQWPADLLGVLVLIRV
ncbi:MAG TPA: helicase-related protein [Anaerolineae bacterium]|nr:helicase-related protein [Anaerolineae bacterium]HQK12699.1 helicase-related protein [Anaerolineae bacterium]